MVVNSETTTGGRSLIIVTGWFGEGLCGMKGKNSQVLPCGIQRKEHCFLIFTLRVGQLWMKELLNVMNSFLPYVMLTKQPHDH